MTEDLRAAVLEALAHATPQSPMRLSQISRRLPWMLTDPTVQAALDDLVDRRAVNSARISADGVRFEPVYWPTGVVPAAVPWRNLAISAHTADDARAAREAAEIAARQPTSPKPDKEPTMTTQTEPTPTPRLFGDVQREVLRLLDPLPESEALDAASVYDRTALASSVGSTRKTLQRLAKLGLIASRVDGVGTQRRAVYWGLQGGRVNLLPHGPRDQPRASKPVEIPEPHPADPPLRVPESTWTMKADTRAPLATLHDDMRFGVYDDGSLEIWSGGHLVLCLSTEQATRLDALLQATMPGLAESHAARIGGQEDA